MRKKEESQMAKDLTRQVAETMIHDIFKMKKGESLAITCDQGSNFPQLEAFLEVAHEQEVLCTLLKTATPPGQSKAAEATIPTEAMTQFLLNVDCWLDAGSKGLLYSNIFETVLSENKRIRYMLIADLSTEMLKDMYCSFDVDTMVEFTGKLVDMLHDASSFTMKDENGTNVTFEMEPKNWIQADNGDASKAGLYTPPASVNVIPKTGTTQGVIAAKAIYADPEPNFATNAPVNIHIQDGAIEKIDGDEKGAAAMNKWYDKFAQDPNAHKVAHTMLGLLPGCTDITGYVVMDERLWGGSCWGYGHVSAYDMPPDGQNSITHFDVICEHVSVWFDDTIIMENGIFVHPELKEIASRLAK